MKIKRKVQKNLPQLIEWAWENPHLSHGMTFISNGCERVKIEFRYNPRGVLNLDILNGTNISNDIQFTLEEFEEITEDTKLDYMYLIANNTDYSEGYYNYSINDVLSDNEGYYIELAILIIDPEPTIIWTRDKGLVE